jgi:hypothetical protein
MPIVGSLHTSANHDPDANAHAIATDDAGATGDVAGRFHYSASPHGSRSPTINDPNDAGRNERLLP